MRSGQLNAPKRKDERFYKTEYRKLLSYIYCICAVIWPSNVSLRICDLKLKIYHKQVREEVKTHNQKTENGNLQLSTVVITDKEHLLYFTGPLSSKIQLNILYSIIHNLKTNST